MYPTSISNVLYLCPPSNICVLSITNCFILNLFKGKEEDTILRSQGAQQERNYPNKLSMWRKELWKQAKWKKLSWRKEFWKQ